MKLLTREQIEELAEFQSEKFVTSSFFLDTKKRRQTKKEILLAVKNLINKAKAILQSMEMDKAVRESAMEDLSSFQTYCSRNIGSYTNSGLALFSCSGKNTGMSFSFPILRATGLFSIKTPIFVRSMLY